MSGAGRRPPRIRAISPSLQPSLAPGPKVTCSSSQVASSATKSLAAAKPKEDEVSALLALPDPDASDFVALDATWEDEQVTFGPGSSDGCKDGLIARIRGGLRPAPDMPAAATHTVPPRQ